MTDDTKQECPCAACQVDRKDHLLHWGWTIMANAHGGDWDKASPEWKSAVEKWRDDFHRQLVEVHINDGTNDD